MSRPFPLLPLHRLHDGQEADTFALLAARRPALTQQGRPYSRVTFRDRLRSVSFPIWDDSPHAAACREEWEPGRFYKLRVLYRETNYGPQLEIRRIREVREEDRRDGFSEAECLPPEAVEPGAAWDQLLALAEGMEHPGLRRLTRAVLERHREALLRLPASSGLHHAYPGGWLRHTLDLAQAALALADLYAHFPGPRGGRLDRSLVIAGALLHDVGKLVELNSAVDGHVSVPGRLLGHAVLARDLVREVAAELAASGDPEQVLEEEMQLRLEHLLLVHQMPADGGPDPYPPATPEALLIRLCDHFDAQLAMLREALGEEASGELTSPRNALRTRVYRGREES